MSTVSLVLFILQGLSFVYWAFLMFSTLFRLRRRGVARTGSANPGPFTMLGEFQYFLTSPEERAARRRLGLATLALFVLIGLSTWLRVSGTI